MAQRKYIYVTERYPLPVPQLETEDYYQRPPFLMKEKDWHVEVWTYFEGQDEPENETLYGLPVRRFKTWYQLRKEIRKMRPDLVHVMAATKENLLLAGALPNMVLTGQNLLLSTNLIKRMIQKYLRRRFDRIICLTPHEVEWQSSFISKSNLVRIPLSIDVDYFSKEENRFTDFTRTQNRIQTQKIHFALSAVYRSAVFLSRSVLYYCSGNGLHPLSYELIHQASRVHIQIEYLHLFLLLPLS